ncbi:MAG: YCF48-related protein, partial [Bacteroidota bacterium]
NAGLTQMRVRVLVCEPISGDVYAGTWFGGLLRSTNGGHSWLTTANQNAEVGSIAVDASANVLATINGRIHLSNDQGATWTPLEVPWGESYVFTIAVSSTDIYYVGTQAGIFSSNDAGQTWRHGDASGCEAHAFVSDVDGVVFAGTSSSAPGRDGIYRSVDDGRTWLQRNSGLRNVFIRSLLLTPSNVLFAAVGFRGVMRSTDEGATWSVLSLSPTGQVRTLVCSVDGVLFASVIAGSSNEIWRSTDGGDNWSVVATSVGSTSVLKVSPNGTLYSSSARGIARSTDNGENWTTHTGWTSSEVLSLDTGNDGMLYAGTSGEGTFRSTNEGDAWVRTSLPPYKVYRVAVDNHGNVFSGTWESGVFRSTNHGLTWTQVDARFSDPYGPIFAVDAEGAILAGTNGDGVYRSTDAGTTWHQMNEGLINTHITALIAGPQGRVLAGTWGNGLFTRTVGTNSVMTEGNAEPIAFALSQNYPNPFNPNTLIGFRTQESRFVSLKVFDLLGREVATLIDGFVPAGTHAIAFSASAGDGIALASGTYVAQLRSGASVHTIRMLLMK